MTDVPNNVRSCKNSSFYFADDPQQQDRADRGRHDRADDAGAKVGSKQAKQPAAKHASDNADDNVQYDALAFAAMPPTISEASSPSICFFSCRLWGRIAPL